MGARGCLFGVHGYGIVWFARGYIFGPRIILSRTFYWDFAARSFALLLSSIGMIRIAELVGVHGVCVVSL